MHGTDKHKGGSMRSLSRCAGVAVAAVALSATLSGQDGFEPRSGYGTDDLQILTLSHVAFLPTNSAQTYLSFCCATDSYRRPTAGFSSFFAPLHSGMIPNGARIERIDVYLRDISADADVDFDVRLCRSWTDPDGTAPAGDCSIGGTTTGAPGDTVLTILPDLPVRYDGDADNDGTPEVVNYVLVVVFGTNNVQDFSSNLRLRGARVLYRRQVTPAPSSATFSDVPVAHPFFQFVEALAASGITAGCGTGIYCPDSPLTRGQMAVFLAKALGLHWPAVVP
jgi:hypothetical protein